ncbi:MAG: 50S ribosomal protein L22 [Candidatus Woesearchaeota archaeon]|nr:MAG: 50S ribosomal protein L22 [Candidatus Woesearchaeota archaeon]
MKTGYSFQTKENMAKTSFRNINISTKHAIEIFDYIRGRPLSTAKRLLQQSIDKKRAIPIKRFTNGPGHKPGISSGRYHVKACSMILKALNAVEANAKNKGLAVQDLRLTYAVAQKAGKQWHYGRKRRALFKNTHIELGVEEVKGLSSKSSSSKSSKKGN